MFGMESCCHVQARADAFLGLGSDCVGRPRLMSRSTGRPRKGVIGHGMDFVVFICCFMLGNGMLFLRV